MNRKNSRANNSLEKKIAKKVQNLREDRPHAIKFDPNALQAYGPIINVDIELADPHKKTLKESGQPIPAPVTCRLLIDTGATRSMVRHEIAQKAGLALINSSAPIHGIGVDTTGKTYFGRITLRF